MINLITATNLEGRFQMECGGLGEEVFNRSDWLNAVLFMHTQDRSDYLRAPQAT